MATVANKKFMIDAGERPELAAAAADILALFGAGASTEKDATGLQGVIALTVREEFRRIMVAIELHLCVEGEHCGPGKFHKELSDCLSYGETPLAAAVRLVKLGLFSLLAEMLGAMPSPWGILRGVRPTKLAHRLLNAGVSPDKLPDLLAERYAVTLAKAKLLAEIALRQKPFLAALNKERDVHIYVGIPYCPSRCWYCSFPAYPLPASEAEINRFFAALERDIEGAARQIAVLGWTVASIYVGGGTPTSLPARLFSRLLELLAQVLRQSGTKTIAAPEFTVEAGRPDSMDAAKIAAIRDWEVTRVSINPQTMLPETLRRIGRKHTVEDVKAVFAELRRLRKFIVNMDVIAGLPGETPDAMAATMAEIAELGPDNLTVHALTVKRGSMLWEEREGMNAAARETIAEQLKIADSVARDMGMLPYYLYRQKNSPGNLENVGYALPGKECLYNMVMIAEANRIIGIGPAAATKTVFAGGRLKSLYFPRNVETYIDNIDSYLEKRYNMLASSFVPGEDKV